MKSCRLALFFGYAMVAFAQQSADPNVLTVCEALRDIDLYRGKMVVIVGRSGFTFEGNFLYEKYEPDDRILIQKHRWLSMIAEDVEEPDGSNGAFPAAEDILRGKLALVKDYHGGTQSGAEEEPSMAAKIAIGLSGRGRWVAHYGRLESPKKLRPHMPPSASSAQNKPGIGYGANGSVPAVIQVIRSKALSYKVE